MRSRVAFGSVVFILVVCGMSVLQAQQPGTVYTGRVSENNYGPLDPRNFPQEDPRQVQPEQMPTAVQGNQPPRCIPPNKKWKLLVQYQDECLYAAPLPKLKKWLYGNNVVIPVSEMQQLGAQAGRCGPDPWDDSKAVCTGGTPSPQPNGAGGKGWRYGPYTYNIPPWNVPAPLKACLSDGTCAPDDPNSTHPHISATPLAAQASAPNCTKGAPGAYDPSANPACERSTAPGNQGYGPPAGYGNPTPGSGQPETSQPGFNTGRMLQLAARMDQIAQESSNSVSVAFDHFFAGLATWASHTLKFLAQKPGEPVGQMSRAIARYLTNDYNQNDQALRQAAMQAVADMQNDPARFWGENLPNLLPLPRLQAVEEINQIEAGAQRLSAVAREAETFGQEFNAGRGSMPNPNGKIGAGTGAACFAKNACVPVAIAQDQLWAEGANYEIQGVHALSGQDLAMDGGDLEQLLRQRYSGGAALNNPYFNPIQRLALQQGIPLAGSIQDIDNVLRAGGNGSRGIVIIRPWQGLQHAFNVRNLNGVIQFWDATQKMDGRLWFSAPLKDIFFYPTG